MFDLGIQELIVIFIVALLVFGPKKLPELGRTLGKGMAELRRAMQGVKEQMNTEMHDLKYPLSVDTRVNPAVTPEETKPVDTPDPAAPEQPPADSPGTDSQAAPGEPSRSQGKEAGEGKA